MSERETPPGVTGVNLPEISEKRRLEIFEKLDQGLQYLTDEEIAIAKSLGDPRVRYKTGRNTIEVADSAELETFVNMGPAHFKTDAYRDIAQAFKKHGVFVLKDEKGESVHFAMTVAEDHDALWIQYILTREDQRRKGAAEAMLRYLIDYHIKGRAYLGRTEERALSVKLLERVGFKQTIDHDHWEYRRDQNR